MKVVVFGANGKVGRKVVQKLLDDGHSVRAFVHSKSSGLGEHPQLQIIKGDVHDAKAVHKALQGSRAVISALGSWHTDTKDILSSGMRNIIPAMQASGIKRIISVTGSGARYSADKPTILDRLSRLAIRLAARQVFDDGEQHIELLCKSKLNWTVVRSPAMREAARHRGYSLDKKAPRPWSTIVRDEVANAMVELVTNKEWRQAAPYIKQN